MIFYHNFTRCISNLSEEDTVAEQMADGCFFMYSRSGDAILYPLTDTQIKELAERWANNIVEQYKEDNSFMNLATAYSQLGMIHDSESKFRQHALPILDLYLKTK